MQTSVIEAPEKIVFKEVDPPKPNHGEVLVQLEGTGVCISNLPVWQGREWFNYPFEPGAPGHEGFGRIADTGPNVVDFKIGDRVSLISYNAYAEYDVAPVENVVRIPEILQNTTFPGEPLACAVNIFERADIKPGHTVLVIGSGFIGSLLIQLIKDTGAKVVAVSRRQTSLDYASKAGADQTVLWQKDMWQTIDEIKKHQAEFPRIIEATGHGEALTLATEMIGVRGKLVIAGFHQDGLRQVNVQTWNWKGIDVINAHERDPKMYTTGLEKAINKTEQGILRPNELISHILPFQEINHAFEMMQNRPEGFLKAIVKYS